VKPAIVVLGSLNMDFVVQVDRLPAPGETVLGRDFQTLPGGKGANQACAAGRLAREAVVRMVGRVGSDMFADRLKASLAAANVDVSGVAATRSQPTGVAVIQVDREGQNSIVVASGANFAFPASDVEGARTFFRDAKFALFQLETPLSTVQAATKLAKEEGAFTILDPAPAQKLTPEFLANVDLITPNENETRLLLDWPLGGPLTREQWEPAVQKMHQRLGLNHICLKLGEQGCYYADINHSLHVPGFGVDAVDTTAAGDTFNGALAVALAEGRKIEEALVFANAAAAISVTRRGAQASIPKRDEVEFLAQSVA
jgi:ribokinase